eukprot:COSAG06_NODE_18696_length_873_cov_0.772610_1_plen_97_part_10
MSYHVTSCHAGGRSLDDVLRIAVEAVSAASYSGLKEVHLVAYMPQEQESLLSCLEALDQPSAAAAKAVTDNADEDEDEDEDEDDDDDDNVDDDDDED